jgi:hypothetical protein
MCLNHGKRSVPVRGAWSIITDSYSAQALRDAAQITSRHDDRSRGIWWRRARDRRYKLQFIIHTSRMRARDSPAGETRLVSSIPLHVMIKPDTCPVDCCRSFPSLARAVFHMRA